ncbi:MAG: polyprenyl diphosphate synthase [Thermoguttaceae bacterium]|jgi:undecaprenyl diphosphate synthase
MQIPEHIAIIMDGNGRWAEHRGLPRFEGHIAGARTVEQIVEDADDLGIEQLTLYCLSSENWKRPKAELDALMVLLKSYVIAQRPRMMEKSVQFRMIGRRAGIPDDILAEIDKTIAMTADNRGIILCLAINYGSRGELRDTCAAIAEQLADPEKRKMLLSEAGVGSIDELITESFISSRLYTAPYKDPDLLIRTAGEFRLSNYLLWQISYAELWVTPVLWPDFRKADLEEAILEYGKRNRKFGGLPGAKSQKP